MSYALGAGGGLTLALVIMAGIREETRVLDIPKLIEGTALNLIVESCPWPSWALPDFQHG